MELFIDDQRVDDAFVGDGTVEDALRHVQENLCPPDCIVVGLRCDGQEIGSQAMGAALRKRADAFERIDVRTGTTGQLVIDAMDQASVCLAQTAETCQEVAQLLTEGKTVEAATALAGCLKVWQQIHEAVAKSIEMLQLDPEHVTVGDEPMIELIRRPKAALLQVREALQSQDYVMLADILQYEFSDVTTSWHDLVGRLRHEGESR